MEAAIFLLCGAFFLTRAWRMLSREDWTTTNDREAYEYLSASFDHGGEFELCAHRRRSLRSWTVTEGFLLVGYAVGQEVGQEPAYPEVFEPVRARPMLTRNWREVRAVQDAAAAIGERLRSWARHLRDA